MIGMQNWGDPKVMLHPDQVRQLMKQQPQKLPNPRGERGVVLRPIWRREDRDFRRPEDFVLLRKLLLYWDVVAWPHFQTFNPAEDLQTQLKRMQANEQAGDDRLDLLMREGALDLLPTLSPFRQGQTHPPEESAWRFQESAYLNLELHEPGQWAMAQSTSAFTSPVATRTPSSEGALGSLTNLLPAPARGVTYPQILEFRRANREALMDFRLLLDELNFQIITNPVSAQAYSAAHRRLDASIRDIWKLAHDQRFEAQRITFGSALAIGSGIVAGVSAVLTAAPLVAFPLTQALIAGGTIGGAVGGLIYRNEHIANPAERQGTTAYLLKAMDDEIIQEPIST